MREIFKQGKMDLLAVNVFSRTIRLLHDLDASAILLR
jgi:hypothetical protein